MTATAPRASFVLLATLALLVTTTGLAEAHPASAYLRVEPQSGNGGDQVRVTGGDWYPDSRVEIRWDSPDGTLLGETTTTSPPPEVNPMYPDEKPRATFETYVTVPDAAGGRHMVFAIGLEADGDSASPATSFEVLVPVGSQEQTPETADQEQSGDGAAGRADQPTNQGTEARATDGRSNITSSQTEQESQSVEASDSVAGAIVESLSAAGRQHTTSSRAQPRDAAEVFKAPLAGELSTLTADGPLFLLEPEPAESTERAPRNYDRDDRLALTLSLAAVMTLILYLARTRMPLFKRPRAVGADIRAFRHDNDADESERLRPAA